MGAILSILRFAWTLIRPDPRRIVGDDPTADVIKFIEDFELSYGDRHPVFYRGTYVQALNDAKRELKFLLVYLHSDSHQDTGEFCRTVLTNEQVIELINRNNLLFWACSVNFSEGHRVSLALRENSYPFLSLIVLKNNRMVSVGRFEGKLTAVELLKGLKRCIDENELSLVVARLEREERNMNNLLRQEQDQAFLESLKVDKEKERKKKEEETKKLAEQRALEEQQIEQTRRRDRLFRLKSEISDMIPPEPQATDAQATKIVIKLPNGTRLERYFLKNQSIKFLYYFVFCHEQSPLQFQIRTNFPSRDLPGTPPTPEHFDYINHSDNTNSDQQDKRLKQTSINDPPTFEECNLGKGAMLFVHDLEA